MEGRSLLQGRDGSGCDAWVILSEGRTSYGRWLTWA